MSRITFGLFLFTSVLLGACEAGTQLQPLGPTTSTLTRPERYRAPDIVVEPGAWAGSPVALGNRLMPMAVTIRNTTDMSIRVSFADFSIFDEQRNRFAVVSPFSLTTAQREARPRAALDMGFGLVLATHPVEDATQMRDDEGQRLTLEQYRQEAVGMGTPLGMVPGAMPLARPELRAPWHQFPAPRGFVYRQQPLVSVEGLRTVGLEDPPGYADLVVKWSSIQPGGPASSAVLRTALPEGVLEPGGEVRGFIYFENPTLHANVVHLVWNVHSSDGTAIGTLTNQFRVVNR
jgi:hypothetical protein